MLNGNLDAVKGDHVLGWAFDALNPEKQLSVNLIIDEKLVASREANLFRSDLKDADIGTGYYGFAIKIPEYFKDGLIHKLQVVCVDFPDEKIGNDCITVAILNASSCAVSMSHDEITNVVFDEEYYIEQAGPTENPVLHYKKIGWKLGYNPNVMFDTDFYIANCGRKLDTDPITDFCLVGMKQYAEVHPLLHVKEYLRIRPDIVEKEIHPLVHYLTHGWKEGVDAFRIFDLAYYQAQVTGPTDNKWPLVHYLKHGWKLGLKPNRYFDPATFANVAELADGIEPLTKFVQFLINIKHSDKKHILNEYRIDTSIIILNHNRSVTTLQSLYFILENTHRYGVEVIVFDNGSSHEEFKLLVEYGLPIRVIRSEANLGFGEGNNVAAELAKGDYLAFVNNDAFVTAGWLDPLLESLQEDGIGGAGPAFYYPNGNLQEAGGYVLTDGSVHQRGKGLPPTTRYYKEAECVTYISAATFVVSKALFDDVLGFDLMWDPAYYEDVDLCLKIQAFGKKIKFEPRSRVIHLEGTTSSDPALRLQNIVAANRIKLLRRWQDWLISGMNRDLLDFKFSAVGKYTLRDKPLLALFTPYPLNPGGGERYLLSVAHALKESYDCLLFTPKFTSRIRLLTMARELNLSLDHVRCLRWSDRGSFNRPDLFFSMGNEVLPFAEAIGIRNYYICQFPFPMNAMNFGRDWGKYDSYNAVITYSEFAKQGFDSARLHLELPHRPIHVIHPPVDTVNGVLTRSEIKRILNVGRFSPGGHCKRQDVMIERFKELCDNVTYPVELHLAGSLPEDDDARNYFRDLQKMSERLKVFFHVNVSLNELNSLYLQSDVYWHFTGVNDSVVLNPERFEHFGITVVEAMSAGCLPIVLGYGGPAEIVQHELSGIHAQTSKEVLKLTMDVLDLDANKIVAFRKAAIDRAKDFNYTVFTARLKALIESR